MFQVTKLGWCAELSVYRKKYLLFVIPTMAGGKVMVGSIVISDKSLNIDQITDVTATTPSSGETLVYKDSAIDTNFSTGWHSTQISTNDLSDATTVSTAQNDLFAYNVATEDPTYGVADGWFPKNIGSIFTDLDATVNSIVGLNTAKIRAEAGDGARTDMVLFTAVEASVGGPTCTIGSNGDNNVVVKKEPTDGSFSFVQAMGKGETLNLTIPAGTVLRSSKGIYGFSGPQPTPLAPQSFALSQCQFYVSGTATLNVVSMGTEVTVSLFSGDQTTLLSGPTVIAAYQTGSFSCPSVGEYFVSSSGPMCAGVNENNSNMRPLTPMTTELLTMNTGCLVSALSATTNVTWYRRNGTSGSITLSPGTAQGFAGAGNNATLNPNGWLRVTADKPITTFTSTDSVGAQSFSGPPTSQLAQLFCNPSFIDSSTSYGEAGVAISSPYEGTATVYTSAGLVLATFGLTRSVAVTTAADQQYPAGGRWKPSDVSGTTTWDGGFIEVNVPSVCVMNSGGDSTWGSAGEEMLIVGSTPEEIKADLKKIDGIWRRRDVSNTGTVTWNIC